MQLAKINTCHKTTGMPSKPCLPCSKLPFFKSNPNNHKKVKKGSRRSNFDAYTWQLVKIDINHIELAGITKQQERLPNHVLPCSNHIRKETNTLWYDFDAHTGQAWRFRWITKQQKHLPKHGLPCSKCFFPTWNPTFTRKVKNSTNRAILMHI